MDRFIDAIELVAATLVGLVAADIFVYTNAFMTLTNYEMHVNTTEHHLDSTQSGPGATNRVDHYDQIIWYAAAPGGTVIMIR